MFRRKLTYFMLIGLLTIVQSPTSANIEQTQSTEKTGRVARIIKNRLLKIMVGTATVLALYSFIYQTRQRNKTNAGFSYTTTECGNYFSSYTINGQEVTEEEYKKAMGIFYIPFIGGVFPASLPFKEKALNGGPIAPDGGIDYRVIPAANRRPK